MRIRRPWTLAILAALGIGLGQNSSVEQRVPGTRDSAKLIVGFDGLGVGFEGPQGPAEGRNPSDNSLAVGPNHVVQIVNSRMAVFDKQGKVLHGAVPTNTIFKGFGGVCEARDNGDAVARYDQLAGRWLYVMPIFSRIAERPDEPYSMCYAVSTGPDPLGPYYRYEFRRKLFPDYPRPAVWPDGYYNPSSTGDNVIQKHACVADRAKMLKGAPATEQCVILDNVNFLNNADIDGQGVPPAGAPNIMMAAGGAQLHNVFEDDGIYVWKFHVDWANPKNTKVSDAVKIPVAPYRYLCKGQLTDCVSQPGTDRKLDAQGDKLMQRLVYRNIGGRESIVALHSVDSSAGGGVRWYEFRLDDKREPRLFQQGTYAPDAFFRWMASASMDRQGNIGIGYSFGGAPNFAGQRFAGHMTDDPPGTLGLRETVLVEGEASQTTGNRWEDYTTTAIDPSDDCTFWYVGDYLKKGAAGYSTRIGAFRMPGCLRGVIAGAAFLDLNHDGKRQEDEPGIAGREIAYAGAESGAVKTGADGAYRISLPADPAYADPVYTIAAKTIHLKDGETVIMDFPSVCTASSSGAADTKFWMSAKGQDAVDRHYGEFKKLVNNTLNLTNADGARLSVKKYIQFRAWLHKPPSALQASLALAGLNTEVGSIDGNATVVDPLAHDWISIHTLLKRISDSKNRDAYKTLLDQLNKNTATVTPSNPASCGASLQTGGK